MTNRAEFERLLDVYGFRCERFGQDLSTHARAQVVSAFAALASAPAASMKPLEPEFAKVLSDNFDSLMVRLPSESAPVAGEVQKLKPTDMEIEQIWVAVQKESQHRPEIAIPLAWRFARAVLARFTAPQADQLASAPVADGWRLVPIEPTEAMEQAAADYLDACVKAWGLWGAMLDAAPPAPRASAPVAGEATYYAVMHGQALFGIFETETAAGDCIAKALYPKVMSIRPLYAAPQASEAVRDALRSAAQQITDLYEGDEWPELAQVLHVLDALSSQPGAQKENGHEA